MFSGWSKVVKELSSSTLRSIYSTVETENQDNMTPAPPRHILNLTRDEKMKFIDSFDLVLSDCDGVLWNLSQTIENSGAAVKLIQDAGKKIFFVSNNSIRSDSDYAMQFEKAGIDTNINDLVHPNKSIVKYLKQTNFKGLIYCIGTTMLKDYLKLSGYDIIEGPNEIIAENFRTLMTHILEKKPVKAIVMDIDFNLSSTKILKADHFLKQKDCVLIAGATEFTLPLGIYGSIMGPGPFVKMLEESSQKTAKRLGKPGKELKQIIMKQFEIKDPKRVLFIGDMLEQDVGFGKLCGFQTMAVLTGGTTKQELMTHDNLKEIPDYYADSLGDFVEFFNSLKCKISL